MTDNDLREEARRLLEKVTAELAQARRPLATYRVQLHKGFDFDDAAAITGYLSELGISDFYTSPYLRAAPGSMHGYDVLDHQQLNPELGGAEGHERFIAAVQAQGLGHLLDIVPNHMGIGSGNALWRDVLENGPSAQAARFFDIEWHPVKEELADKVLVPVLGDRYGAVLERGELRLVLLNGAFEIHYFDNVFPVNPRSYVQILNYRMEELEKLLQGDIGLDDLKSIITALQNMPTRNEVDAARMEERRREKEVAKRRVAHHCEKNPAILAHLLENVRLFNGTPGKPRSFDLLDRLLAAQAYRLAHWRVSSEEINYRRFFDINSLAAIRVEDPVVFEEAHRVPLRLLAEGKVTGLRVDHPDGLAHPTDYFRLLQDAHILQRAQALSAGADWARLEPAVRAALLGELRAHGRASPLFRPLFVVAEKILGRTETLPSGWAVSGTTGYDAMNAINGIFVDRRNEHRFEKMYARFIGAEVDFDELVYQKKKLILYTALASEMNLLARQLNRISEGNRWTRDFTLYALRAGLIELVACFPVYRTYIADGRVDERDRRYILQAVAGAKRRNPAENASIYDFIADILLQKFGAYVEESELPAQRAFAVKLQQVLGPVMAKGVEDTTFYVYNRLTSLNEVGGEPHQFGSTVEWLHEQNAWRAREWPLSLVATATHDTKRGEDTRARIDALSELPEEFRKLLAVFARRTEPLRREVDGRHAPDRNEQMLLLQTLLGVWPAAAGMPGNQELESLRERVQEYLFKAAKEAKVNTSWIQEDQRWEEALRAFVSAVFALPARHKLWGELLPFARRIGEIGLHNSLSQLVLKLAMPGVPDIYQGCELWDFSLVDPDNRRPVDFALRKAMLAEQRGSALAPAQLARELYESWEDGRIKLFITQAGLQARKRLARLFTEGGYEPLRAEGPRAENVCAFARTGADGRLAIAVVPRLVAGLLDGARLNPDSYSGTRIQIPNPGSPLRDVFTGEVRQVHEGTLGCEALFSTLPVALLVNG
jgi:(1->4)-alpha-D-glucan 1-alpha-D-glucosylmutase